MAATPPPHEDAGILIEATHNGEAQSMRLSRYNAARVLSMLCFMLEIPHPKALSKLPM